MTIVLVIQYIHFDIKRWWKDEKHLAAVVSSLVESKLPVYPCCTSVNDKPLGKNKHFPLADLPEQARSKPGRTIFAFSEAPRTLSQELRVRLLDGALDLEWWFADDPLEPERATVLDRIERFVLGTYDVLGEHTQWGIQVRVDLRTTEYPRARPPRFMFAGAHGCALEFISARYARECKGELVPPEVDWIHKLIQAPVPRVIQRSIHGELAVFRWIDDFTDDEQVASRLALREQWLHQYLDLPMDSNYNERGDERVYTASLTRRRDGAYYSQGEQRVVKAIPVIRGKLEATALQQLLGWKKVGKIGRSGPVARIEVVVQSRADALKVRDKAVALGVDAVHYVDDEGSWWDPVPPGIWATEPHPELADQVPPP